MNAGPLRRLRDGLSVAQIGLAVVGVAQAGGVSLPSLALFAVLMVVAWRRTLPEAPSVGASRAWTLLVFVALVATLARAVLRAEFLDAGVDFLLLLAVQRTFNRQRAREHAQLLLLGALMMVVGSVINTEPTFPLLLAGYLLVATMALLTNTLMGEGERLGTRVMARLEHEGHRRRRSLWRASAGVATLAGVGALLTFLLFPRWGVGVFLRGQLPGEVRSGFSDEVQLGGFGTIKTDATVVMRIRPDHDPGTTRPTWHLRGSSFDRYEGGRWEHGADAIRGPLRVVYGRHSVTDDNHPRLVRPGRSLQLQGRAIPGYAGAVEVHRASVILEDIGADLLFVPSPTVAVKVQARGALESRARPIGGRNHEIRVNKMPGPLQYRAVWRTTEPSRAELAAMGNPPQDPELATYLQRSQGLSPAVGELARRLTADAPDRLSRVQAIMQHLARFEYTLEQRSSARVEAGADPLEGFLFDTQAGHCEYYATALAVLLREVNVPTRIVNGYYGAHLNKVGGFFAVRQADAHSWVEVHFGDLGWVTFDPTPPSGRIAGDDAAWWPAATELLDAMRNTYLEYVIDYDLSKQLAILEQLGLRDRGHQPRGAGRWILVGVIAIGAGLWLGRRWRRRRRDQARPETVLLQRVLQRLAAKGHATAPDDTPHAIASRVRASGAVVADDLDRFLRGYEALRFGPAQDEAALTRLRSQADAVLQQLQS
ncbi:MAG: DUF3488 and transglutaminase-like domain-containing protein [Deltaproteobacteria bacterium]|nr:DUF3488 and transglutaminase-like domain-containing protein [Deltaproteobacteria bacterium]